MGITKGKLPGPRKLLLYAPHGVGKSSFAAGAPNPLFIDIEQGTHDLDIARWDERINSFPQFMSILGWARTQQHDFQTLVIDTIDWLEKLIFAEVAGLAGVESLADIDYGKGFPRTIPRWEKVLNTLAAIVHERRMGIVLLGHARIEKVSNPEGAQYDRYAPDLWTNARNEGVSNMVQEWCDEVFFMRKKRYTRTEGKGFNERGLATGTEEREILTSDTAWASAKNRLGMPTTIPAPHNGGWQEYRKWIIAGRGAVQAPASNGTASGAFISGIVIDGSSKPPEPPTAEAQESLAAMESRF
jgi:hypothetical protein